MTVCLDQLGKLFLLHQNDLKKPTNHTTGRHEGSAATTATTARYIIHNALLKPAINKFASLSLNINNWYYITYY